MADILMWEWRNRLPVSGHANLTISPAAVICPCPTDLRPRAQPVRWLLERSTVEGSQDALLWTYLGEHLGPIAEKLRIIKEQLEFLMLLEAPAFVKAFNRLLRQKPFVPSFLEFEAWENKLLSITFCLLDDRVLIDLQKEAYALAEPKPEREKVERGEFLEERDKLIYEKARAGMAYSEIRGLVMRKYPAIENLGHLHVTVSRIFQIAYEYAERHGLPKPKPRRKRQG
jgi:hypothetical protein